MPTPTHLTTSDSGVNAASYNTASITPTANRAILIWVANVRTAGTSNIPTLTGNGLTWVQVATVLAGTTDRLTLLRTMGASPSAGAVTIDFAGQTQAYCMWSISEWDGVNTGGTNGSAAIVQAATNAQSSVTALTVTLGAFTAPANATAGGVYVSSIAENIVPGTGFTELGEIQDASELAVLESEWRADNDPTVDWSWTTGSNNALGIAVEIAAAPSGGWSMYRPYTLGAALSAGLASGLFYYWRRRKQEKPDE